ncbi:hypothetical protein [Burkholderia thailandensis]|uniref:hypothetical protein n=1 Tax=Burkholderia thailandensis TaxID=57975 RepID=UPI0009B69FC5|nr:hypothetical protein [Burkholderia thailandensis]MCS3391998.1 hypothetical protein [Burkholderia thailandensis]MCS3397284.1 hypothetical protein [Burkholderia thailandensis]MCS6425212.1 hypothetical protein [Burkholderia thailandensis]MCS6453068.1 hypothetical protein [Burkholderia thailandensis]MCS6464611.1 hypothetical protein [Burkholderia thailandensis]
MSNRFVVGLSRPFGGELRRRPVSKPARAGFFFALRGILGNVGRLAGDRPAAAMRRRVARPSDDRSARPPVVG